MRNTYATLSTMALALLVTASASGQTVRTAQDAARQEGYAIKKHESAQRGNATTSRMVRGSLKHNAPNAGVQRGPIANDLCADATVLTMNAPGECPGAGIAGNNAGAGNDGGDPACDVTTTAFEDVWYAFNSGDNTAIVVEVTMGDMTDLIVEVLEGGCAGTSVYCDFNTATNAVTVMANTEYVIRIGSNNDFGLGGTFDICLSSVGGGGSLANDECDAAVMMTVGTECVAEAYTLTDATQSMDPATCTGFTSGEANDAWFSFEATSTTTIIEVTGGGDATTGVDLVLEAFSGDCMGLAQIICVDATVRGGTESLTLTTVIGTTYYYRTYNWIYDAGQATLDFTTCVHAPSNVPANDLCDGAVAQDLAIGATVVFNGDNTGALDTEGFGAASVWEAFTTTECSFLELSYCGTTPAFGNLFLQMGTDCPVTAIFGEASFNDTDCGDGNFTVYFENVPAGTYYYPVLSEPGSVGPYTISVTATACPAGYCAASADLCDEFISNVMFGSIDNTSDCADGPAVDYTAFSTDVVAGNSYPIVVSNGLPYDGDQVVVWVDWNQNENFSDAGEAYTLTSADLNETFTGNIDVPLTALQGPTRMRIRMMYTGTPSPCGTSAYGEVEDYTVDVIGIITGVNEVANSTFVVFPNPGNGDMTIRYDGSSAKATIDVIDVTGRTVYTQQRALNAGQPVQLSLAGELATGTYVLRLTTDERREERRIVIR